MKGECGNGMQKNLKKFLIASDPDNFPEELLKAINDCKEEDNSGYLQAFAKIAYWFNNSDLNYDMNFVCYEGKESRASKDLLNSKQLSSL